MDSLQRKVESRAGFIAARLRMDLARDLGASAVAHGHVATGQMASKTRVTDRRLSPTAWQVRASNPTVQAATTNFGARPHLIRPKQARALRFYSPKAGRVVFAQVVHHPGNRPSHWFSDVMSPAHVQMTLRKFVGR